MNKERVHKAVTGMQSGEKTMSAPRPKGGWGHVLDATRDLSVMLLIRTRGLTFTRDEAVALGALYMVAIVRLGNAHGEQEDAVTKAEGVAEDILRHYFDKPDAT